MTLGVTRAVVALADEAAVDVVAVRDGAEPCERLLLGHCVGQRERCRELDRAGHDRIDQRIERRCADDLQHLGDFGVVRTDVACVEFGVVLELVQCGHRGE